MSNATGKQYLEVILPLHIAPSFTYSVPKTIKTPPKTGNLVICPFGKSRKYLGLVKGKGSAPDQDQEIREIDSQFAPSIEIPDRVLKIWEWVAEYYMIPIGSLLELALGGIFSIKSREVYRHTGKRDEFFGQRSSFLPEWLDEGEEWTPRQIKSLADGSFLRKLVKAGFLERSNDLVDPFKPQTRDVIQISPTVLKNEKRTEKILESLSKARVQKKAFEILLEKHFGADGKNPTVPVPELQEMGVNRNILRQLEIKGIVNFNKEEIPRINFLHRKDKIQEQSADNPPELFTFTLTDFLEDLKSEIKDSVKKGEQVLLLLPEENQVLGFAEILTKNNFSNFNLYSRATSKNEKRELFEALAQSVVSPVVGGSFAALLPFSRLDKIFLLNEHNQLYKRHSGLNINFKDLSLKLAREYGSKLILQSPSPTVETLNHFEKLGRKVDLGTKSKPDLKVLFKPEQWKKNLMKGSFSKIALEEMQKVVEKGGQVLVLQNRKGYASYLECEECHHVPKCPNCDVSLTYFKSADQLKCRYCGEEYPNSPTCPNNHQAYKTMGGGTEKLEEELSILFDKVRILRVDSESIRGKRSLEKVKREFEQNLFPIIISTHFSFFKFNFENLDLAVVPNFDQYLNLPDFRNQEHAFQVIKEVAGFFSPKKQPRIIIQSSSRSGGFIAKLKNWDYLQFVKEELEERKEFKYPPFQRLIRISTFCNNNTSGLEFLTGLNGKLNDSLPADQLLGPFEPPIRRIRNEYIHQLLIKELPNQSMLSELKEVIIQYEETTLDPYSKKLRVEYDVDPLN